MVAYCFVDEPRTFLVSHLEQLKEAKKRQCNFPCLFNQSNVESAFGIMDPTGRGFITSAQYQEGSTAFFDKQFFLHCTHSSFLPRCTECRRGLAMRKLSVCPSDKRVDCDKTEERYVQIFIPYERSFSLVFWQEEWLVGATPSTWNFGSKWLRWS